MKRLVCAFFVGTGLAIAPTISALAASDAAGSGNHSVPAQQLPLWVAQANQTGTIESNSMTKDDGFIKPDEGGQSIYFETGGRKLKRGQKVMYDKVDGAKRPLAVNVRPY